MTGEQAEGRVPNQEVWGLSVRSCSLKGGSKGQFGVSGLKKKAVREAWGCVESPLVKSNLPIELGLLLAPNRNQGSSTLNNDGKHDKTLCVPSPLLKGLSDRGLELPGEPFVPSVAQ